MKPPTASPRRTRAPTSVFLFINISKGRPPTRARWFGQCPLQLRREVLARIHKPVFLDLILLVVQLPISAGGRQQFVMAATLDDFAGLEHENLVRAPDRRQAMR